MMRFSIIGCTLMVLAACGEPDVGTSGRIDGMRSEGFQRGLTVQFIGADHVLGIWRDELNVEHVRRHRLVRPSTAPR